MVSCYLRGRVVCLNVFIHPTQVKKAEEEEERWWGPDYDEAEVGRQSVETVAMNARRYVRKSARKNLGTSVSRQNAGTEGRRYIMRHVRQNVRRYVRKNVRRYVTAGITRSSVKLVLSEIASTEGQSFVGMDVVKDQAWWLSDEAKKVAQKREGKEGLEFGMWNPEETTAPVMVRWKRVGRKNKKWRPGSYINGLGWPLCCSYRLEARRPSCCRRTSVLSVFCPRLDEIHRLRSRWSRVLKPLLKALKVESKQRPAKTMVTQVSKDDSLAALCGLWSHLNSKIVPRKFDMAKQYLIGIETIESVDVGGGKTRQEAENACRGLKGEGSLVLGHNVGRWACLKMEFRIYIWHAVWNCAGACV